jgi:hypothetical protein
MKTLAGCDTLTGRTDVEASVPKPTEAPVNLLARRPYSIDPYPEAQ